MKKMKLLTPVLGAMAITSGLIPLASCSSTNTETDKIVPSDAFEVKDVTLKGFKEDYDYKNYTTLVIPSNVKVIETDAFNAKFTPSYKLTSIVIPGNVETIRKGAFANNNAVTVYDFSQYTIDQIYALEVEAGAFGDMSSNGIYSYVKMNDEWTDIQKEVLMNKLITGGFTLASFVKQTKGNVEVNSSSPKEQTANAGVGQNIFDVKGQFSSQLQYKAILTVTEASEGVDVEHNPICSTSSDYKTVYVDTQMVAKDEHKFVEGDYVTYKVTIVCYTGEVSSNSLKAIWSETLDDTFKLTYHNILDSIIDIKGPTLSTYKAGQTFDATGLKVQVQYSNTDKEWIEYGQQGLITNLDDHVFSDEDVFKYHSTGLTGYAYYTLEDITKEAEFKVSFEKSLYEINIAKPAKTLEFYVGDTFSSEELAINIYYNDDTGKEGVTTGFTTNWDGKTFEAKDVGDQTVTVTYTEDGVTKTTSYPIKVSEEVKAVDFKTCEWSEIIKWANYVENKTKTIDQLCAHFLNGEEPIEKVDDFVGLERDLIINTVPHKVRVLEVQHDKDLIVEDGTVTNKKATFTFETVTLLSNSDGSFKLSKMATYNYNFTSSDLQWNLNGTGSGTKPTYAWDTSVLDLLPNDVKNDIKTVQKEVAINANEQYAKENYIVTKYNDKLFPLTLKEMNQTSTKVLDEGSAYKYWINNDQQSTEALQKAGRVKKNYNGDAYKYWLISPQVDVSQFYGRLVHETGAMSDYYCSISSLQSLFAVSFAFCI